MVDDATMNEIDTFSSKVLCSLKHMQNTARVKRNSGHVDGHVLVIP